jgi:fructoselysine 6-phosphate deglycase
MAIEFDRERFLADFQTARARRHDAAALGAERARRGLKRLWFVGPGAPNKLMSVAMYWAQRHARDLDLRLSFPAELVHQEPPALDEGTVVVLASHSGTTKETVRAAEYLQGTGAVTVGVTSSADSPLARAVDHPLTYGPGTEGYGPSYILVQALVSAVLQERGDWDLHERVMTSLDALPVAMADATEASTPRAEVEARAYRDETVLYTVGAGPCFSAAYVIGACMLMEMQWLHCQPVVAAEFFHGPFEVVDDSTVLILFVGEDPSRPEAERAVRFCRRFTERTMVYDSCQFAMPGVDPEVRGIVAPIVLQAALEPFVKELAVLREHPLSTRRYMGRMEY